MVPQITIEVVEKGKKRRYGDFDPPIFGVRVICSNHYTTKFLLVIICQLHGFIIVYTS